MKAGQIESSLRISPSYQKYLNMGHFRSHFLPMLRAVWYLRSATRMGKMVRVWGRPCIHNEGTIIIGDRVRLLSTVATLELAVKEGLLEIQEDTYINYGTTIAAMLRVQIGAHCRIGTYVMITDNNFHRLEPERRDELPQSAPVILEKNVWLGGRVIVLPGVTIGADSVIGAGSVVTHDIPPRSVAVGAPARVVKTF